jgi:ribosomal protein S12 methylthiotransferase RimO
MSQPTKTVHILTLGCARNETDSDELAGRLSQAGWELVEDPGQATAVLVNTCGFVETAKTESIQTILQTADLKNDGVVKAVVAIGCMAERYGKELASEIPDADAVLGFDAYEDLGQSLAKIVGGAKLDSHEPVDRRLSTPKAPAERNVEGSSSKDVIRLRLDSKPYAPLKIANGCDRRCTFCAIPAFRGSFVSRRPTDIIAEAVWLSERGVRELFLVSENTTSYGKDLGDMNLLEALLPALASIEKIERIRVSYLQPAEMRPNLISAIVNTEKVVPYFDLSFQHAAPTVLRRMRRFGGKQEFLDLIAQIRKVCPDAGIRSNFIVGFPGETDAELETLCEFINEAELDSIGIFGYSDEDGTEALKLDGKLSTAEINRRVEYVTSLVDEVTNQKAESRIGSTVTVMIESTADGFEGRADFQGPEVDGTCIVETERELQVGDFIQGIVIANDGVDLIVEEISN